MILDQVTEALVRDTNKKFCWSEMYVLSYIFTYLLISVSFRVFFEMWWNEQSPETQAQFRNLVDTGRLEFVGGMNVVFDSGMK